jgi:hypothetical protein
MKFCKDCRFKSGKFCYHKNSLSDINLVYGTKTYRICQLMREYDEFCGEDAKLFEPSLFYKMKRMIWKKN